MTYFLVSCVAVALLGGSVAAWRFLRLRKRGIPLAVRTLPGAPDSMDWRHAVLVMSEKRAFVYRLRSLRPGFDSSFSRHSVHVESRRELTPAEQPLFEHNEHVLVLQHDKGHGWEIAVNDSGDTALVAWIESAPSSSQLRRLPTNIEQRYWSARNRSRRAR